MPACLPVCLSVYHRLSRVTAEGRFLMTRHSNFLDFPPSCSFQRMCFWCFHFWCNSPLWSSSLPWVAFLPSIRPSRVVCKSLSSLTTSPIYQCSFSLPFLSAGVFLSQEPKLQRLTVHLTLSIRFHISHASSFLRSAFRRVTVYVTTHRIKVLTNSFLISCLNPPIKIGFSFPNTFSAIAMLRTFMSFSAYMITYGLLTCGDSWVGRDYSALSGMYLCIFFTHLLFTHLCISDPLLELYAITCPWNNPSLLPVLHLTPHWQFVDLVIMFGD